uniref:DNA (cytosine-5-)-methyltransferase n=1 Tax=Timema genevievae TaxID=629358 RepID=A0A7R9JNM1_TIMGE|nr:unnamed protein product [Timema genevievae]
MGYQCTFGILQAGSYGIPQTRRRLIILATASGYSLPKFPLPTHVFSPRTCSLDVIIDTNKMFDLLVVSKHHSLLPKQMIIKKSPTLTAPIKVTTTIDRDSHEICVPTSGIETKKRPEIPFIFYWLFFKYSQNLGHSAPLRTITVKDSIGDLPGNCGGAQMKYKNCRISPFQKQMRGNSKILHDHETKSLSRLCQERIKNIPKKSGADWRDLPNIEIKNKDGLLHHVCDGCGLLYLHTNTTEYHLNSLTIVLIEVHLLDKKDLSGIVDQFAQQKSRQYKYGKDQNGIMRGVCSCADGKVNESCNINDRQFNTLIPWWLPHTAERNNNFAGVYGRLDWEDHFSTTLTKPNPQGKQGRVLHPQEDRIISIRECARSQGFFDTFRFYGSIAERYRQVGNAVAPPLAAAIGYEIRKCLVKKQYITPLLPCGFQTLY